MTKRRERLLKRIAALTPEQRRTLAGRVEPPGGGALAAYVVTSGAVSAPELRSFLKEQLPEHMVPATVTPVDALPRTETGKIDRSALATSTHVEAADDCFPEFVAPRNETEEQLASIWSEVLGLERVSVHDDFFAIGGDSLLSIRLLSRAGRHGLRIEPEKFFARPSIAAMAAIIAAQDGGPAPAGEQGVVTGRAPLMPIQHWFFEQVRTDRHHWNQSYLLAIPADATARIVSAVVAMLVSHHDGLRTRFEGAGHLQQQVVDPPSVRLPCRFVDLWQLEAQARSDGIAAECRDEQQRARLDEGRLARFLCLDCGPDAPKRLLVVVHHLLIDAHSWGILLEDLSTLLDQGLAGQPLALPPKTAGVLEWSRALTAAAQRPEMREEVRPWLDMPDPPASPGAQPLPDLENRCGDAASVHIVLDPAATTALTDVGVEGRTALELLLAALVLAWNDHCGIPILRLDVEGHGRDILPGGPDVSRTVGWFTTVFPIVLTAADSLANTVRQVSATYRALGRKGASHGMARYLGAKELQAQLARTTRPRVLLNYLGRAGEVVPPGGLLQRATEDPGRDRSPAGERAYLIEINARVSAGCLRCDLSYNPAVHTRDSAESLARCFEARLRDVAGKAGTSQGPFELSGLDASGLKHAAALLDEANEG